MLVDANSKKVSIYLFTFFIFLYNHTKFLELYHQQLKLLR